MKLKQTNLKQILKLHLIKSKIYKDLNSNFDITIANLKKILQIVFQYHKKQKKILFIGLPENLAFKINTQTQHLSVDSNFDFKSLSQNNSWKNPSKSKSVKQIPTYLLPKFRRADFDLIVLVSHEKETSIINENLMRRTPLILFTENVSLKTKPNFFYVLELNKKSLRYNKNIFFILLSFIFKNNG